MDQAGILERAKLLGLEFGRLGFKSGLTLGQAHLLTVTYLKTVVIITWRKGKCCKLL